MTTATKPRPGRNEPCHCGSGRKYKHCCLAKDEAEAAKARAEAAATVEPGAAEAEAAPATAPPPPKHRTHQPWKATSSRGFVPRSTAPRKMGGG